MPKKEKKEKGLYDPVITAVPEWKPLIPDPNFDIGKMPSYVGDKIHDAYDYIKDLFWTLTEAEREGITSAPRQGGKKESKENEKAGGKYPLLESDYYDPVKALAYKNLIDDVENSGYKITYRDLRKMLNIYGSIGCEEGKDIYVAEGLSPLKELRVIAHEWIGKDYIDHEGNDNEISKREKKVVKSYL